MYELRSKYIVFYLDCRWRIHEITPLPKKGDLSCVNNYRPISLLCIISKILESIIYEKIISFI